MNNFIKGSEWRKWDLHVHTPSSFDYDDKSITDDQIIKSLLSKNVVGVAITDHHLIDVKRIKSLQEKAKDSIAFFPGIELRTDKGGSESVHIIGIFPNDIDLDSLWTKIQGNLKLTPSDIQESGGDDKIFCSLEKATDLIHECGGIVSIHAGKKSNSIENITNALPYKMALKKEILQHIDIFEIGTIADFNDYLVNVYPNIKKHPPMILCSDCHNCNKYKLKDNLWIKSDLTFQGLKQVINEPQDRVFLGQTPSKLLDILNNKSHYITSINLNPLQKNKKNYWFDCSVPLNPGLVAIIGKKGSGKSALADSLALAGKSHVDPSNYSFLRNDKFRKKGLANDYKAVIQWADKSITEVKLGENINTLIEVEKVKYLPQSFVEIICNNNGINKLFQNEIDKVIYSYIPDEQRLNTANLEHLVKLKTGLINNDLVKLREDLSRINEIICQLEDKKLSSYVNSLINKLDEKKKELNNLPKPKEVKKPNSLLDKKTETKVSQLKKDLEEIDKKIDTNRQELKVVNEQLTKITNISLRLDQLSSGVQDFIKEYKKDLEELGINKDKLVQLLVEEELIKTKKDALVGRKIVLENLLLNENKKPDNLIYKKQQIEQELHAVYSSLDKNIILYREYEKDLQKYKNKQLEIEGIEMDNSLLTIKSIEKEISYVKNSLDVDLEKNNKKRIDLVENIYMELSKKISFYEEIYSPLITAIAKQKDKQKKSGNILNFSVQIVFDRQEFPEQFLSYIDQSRDGSFQGKVEGITRLKEILLNSDLKTKKGIIDFTITLLDHLKSDKSSNKYPAKQIDQQLKGERVKSALYNFLFGLSYLDVKYNITFNNKDLNDNEFSPGEIGALLLIFYLLIDKEKIPLIIDQPEENLDNESISALLVPYIQEAKQERQIIIVTHNPNLAVVCDAEQVIHAEMNKRTLEIKYFSGSIENSIINKKITDVLEGTMPAFRKRDSKYFKS